MRAFQVDELLGVRSIPWTRIAIILGAHAALGLLVYRIPSAGTLHALAALSVGLWLATARPMTSAAYAAGYIMGAEVFWRMAEAAVPWEFGKYAISLVLLLSMLRHRCVSGPASILTYFALLIPSAWLTFLQLEPNMARQFVSFNLSGPFALLVCAWFFSHLKVTRYELRGIFISVAAPTVAIMMFALYGTIMAAISGELIFHTESNTATSGGFGPNQVSSMLGLGAVLCIFYLILGPTSKPAKCVLLGAAVLLLLQSALTFSRSGLALALACAVVASFYLAREARFAKIIFPLAGIMILVGAVFIAPRLNSLTGQALMSRFSSLSTTGRAEVVLNEVSLWSRSPIIGVGAGMGSVYRAQGSNLASAAHTEFSRLVAEHGILGFAALVILLSTLTANLFRRRNILERAVVSSLIVWTLLYMLVNAFRLGAPAYLIGLTFATLLLSTRWIAPVDKSAGQEFAQNDHTRSRVGQEIDVRGEPHT